MIDDQRAYHEAKAKEAEALRQRAANELAHVRLTKPGSGREFWQRRYDATVKTLAQVELLYRSSRGRS
jgi:hypothetical protein